MRISARCLTKVVLCLGLVIASILVYPWASLIGNERTSLIDNEREKVELNRPKYSKTSEDKTKQNGSPLESNQEYHCPYVPSDPEEIGDIFSSKTIQDLKERVSGFNKSRPVVLIMANEPALYLVANWICIARMTLSSPPTENLLVTIHDSLHGADYLMGRGINSVFIAMSKSCMKRSQNKLRGWYKALTSRILIVMLLTEWGFDVMVHDPDAYIIKDPSQMYSDIIKARDPHIISQKGRMPIKAKLKWGFALVLGAVLYRSSPKLRYIWQKFSEAEVALLDDQRVFNMILLGYGMKWETSHSIYNSTFGQTHNGIRAVALDASYSYRGNVSTEMEGIDTDKLVILHPFLGRDLKRKINTLHKMNLWQLRVSEDEFFALLKDDNAGSGEQWFGRICKKKGQLQVSFDGVKRTVLV